jgi:hypothetical protein
MRQREHSGEAIPGGSGAFQDEAIRATILIVAVQRVPHAQANTPAAPIAATRRWRVARQSKLRTGSLIVAEQLARLLRDRARLTGHP